EPVMCRHSDREWLAPPDARGRDLDLRARGIDACGAQRLSQQRSHLDGVAADLSRETSRLRGRGVLSDPALQRVAKGDDAEEQRREHGQREHRLDRGAPTFVADQRIPCSCAASPCSRLTRPLFQDCTPMTSVPRTTAAPTMYSTVDMPPSPESI